MDNNKKYVMPIIYCVCAMLIVLGVSYAYWYLTKVQTGKNVITTGCLQMEFTENSDAIELLSAMPTSEEDGAKLNPYTFTITNTCNSTEYYSINLETLDTTTLSDNYVRVKLNNDDSSLLSELTSVDVTLNDASSAKNIATGTLESNETKEYNLRIYLGGEEATDSSSMNKTFESKVTIIASLEPPNDPISLYTIEEDNDNDGEPSIGDLICFGSECFYVISRDNGTIKALSRYNLGVGYTCYNTNYAATCNDMQYPTGLQMELAGKYLSTEQVNELKDKENVEDYMKYGATIHGYGYTDYYDVNDENRTKYSYSKPKVYVDNYINKLNEMYHGVNFTGRLITAQEIADLINDGQLLKSATDYYTLSRGKGMDWLSNRVSWVIQDTGTSDEYVVWSLMTDNNKYDKGVRPVIIFNE